MPVQERNSELVQLLAADFQRRYEPNFAWKSAVSAALALPVLRAFWPMSSVDYAAATQVRDVSGGAYHLTNNNSANLRYATGGIIAIADFNGTTQWFSRADGGAANWADITGTEAYVGAAMQGLTLGGWFYFDDAAPPAAAEFLMGKQGGAGQRSYWLWRNNVGGEVQFSISVDGTAITTIASTDVAAASQWYFIAGRFDPSTTLEVFMNGTWTTLAAGIPASIFDSTADFTIGAASGGGSYFDGKSDQHFLSACDMSDAIIGCFYDQTRAMFGV